MATTNANRYQIFVRALTDQERTKIVQKEIEIIQESNQLGAAGTVTESISVQSSDNDCAHQKLLSPSVSLSDLKNQRQNIEEEIIQINTYQQNKRQKIDSVSESNGEVATNCTNSCVKAPQIKDDLSPPRVFDISSLLLSDNSKESKQRYQNTGPSSLQVELGSNSKTNVTIEEAIDDKMHNNDSNANGGGMAQDDVFQMLLARSPIEESKDQIIDQQSQENYHLMHLNMADKNSIQASPPALENFILNDNQIPLVNGEANHEIEEIKVTDQSEHHANQQQLKKRDLKLLDKKRAQEKHSMIVQEQVMIAENLLIQVKDLETLNHYETTTEFNTKFLPKLYKWIKAKKYTCSEHVTDDKLTLKVKIFSFNLTQKLSNEPQFLLDEIKAIKKERKDILKQLKLFQYFVFNIFPEESRKILSRIPQSQIQKYIDDPEHLFIRKEALGLRELRDGHSQHYLVFSEEMCFDEEPQRYPNIFSDKLLIYGPDFEFQICPLKRKELVLDTSNDDCSNESAITSAAMKSTTDTVYRYKYNVSLPVRDGEMYWVYFHRLF